MSYRCSVDLGISDAAESLTSLPRFSGLAQRFSCIVLWLKQHADSACWRLNTSYYLRSTLTSVVAKYKNCTSDDEKAKLIADVKANTIRTEKVRIARMTVLSNL